MSLSLSAREKALGGLEERELFVIFRRRYGVTQRDVSLRAGIRQPLVSVWEKGSVQLSREKIDALWAAADSLVSEVDRGAA